MHAPAAENRVPLITLPNWVKAAAACGFGIAPVLAELGIEADLAHVDRATIPAHDLDRLMTACVLRARRRHFPFALGETFAFEYLPELETFLATSPTLRESARVFEWLRLLINPYLRLEVHEQGRVAALRLDPPDGRDSRIFQWFVEATFVSVLKFGRELLQGRGEFRALRFRHARPDDPAEAEAVYRLPLYFEQPHNALELDRRLLDQRLDGAFEALHREAEARVAERLTRSSRDARLAARLEALIERRPELLRSGIAGAAAALKLHPRTLQRRLAAEQVRYAELQAAVRQKLACAWLRQPAPDIETIAERLGFADRRSFTRAFHRWTGQTPSAYRQG